MICSKCGINKDISHFRKVSETYHRKQCKDCEKVYKMSNIERIRETKRKWYYKNKW